MNRFNYEEPEDYGDEFFFPDDIKNEDFEKYLYESDYDLAKLNISINEMNQKLLFRVIKTLEKSWFWSWRSEDSKIKKIAETFLTMKNLLKICDQVEEEQETDDNEKEDE